MAGIGGESMKCDPKDSLLPCPFCGGKAMDAGARGESYEVCCSGCPVFIVELNRTRAFEAWNRRSELLEGASK